MDKSLKDVLSDDFWIMPATPEFVSEGVPYITSKNIKCGKIDFSKINYISQDDFNTISRNRPIQIGDILISMIGTLGEIAEVTVDDGKFYGQNMFLIRLDEKQINKRYFFNFFNSNRVKRDLTSKMNQSTQKYLKANHIEDLIIPVFAMDEQKEIAENLDTIQSIITHRKQQLSKLDQLVKARFVEMFGLPGTDEFGWGLSKIGDICEINPKKASDKRLDNNLEISFIPMPAVSEKGDIDPTEIRLYEEVKTGFTYFADNDVLFAKITPCMENGKGCVARGLRNGIGFGSTEFHVLRPSYKTNPYWLYTATVFKQFREEAAVNMTGSAGQRRVPAKYLENFKITLPPFSLQQQFADFVTQVEKVKTKVKESLDNSQTLFDSLMQEYFG